jgi:molybdopterin-guanine dinucleotide biosynthesis protein A
MKTDYPPTFGLVLAGGLARRMGGGDKAKIEINGITILDRELATLSAQCVGIAINANGDPKRFADADVPIIPDNVEGFVGPLAGILAGLDWLATQNNGVEWMLSVPGVCPFLPDDLAERLHAARRKMGAGVPLACARSGEWRHPVVALWPLALRGDLRKALTAEGLRKIEMWTARHGVAIADWPDQPLDPFFNVNTPDDVKRAQQLGGG